MHLKEYPLKLSGMEAIICFSTTIIQPGKNGKKEVRNADWQDPMWRYNLKHTINSKADANIFQAFFITVKGRETAFLIKDKLDFDGKLNGNDKLYLAEAPDGVRTEFQIVKRYTDALNNTYERVIKKPLVSSMHFYRLDPGEVEFDDTEFSINESTGKLTTLTAFPLPADLEIYLRGEFYVPIRFDIDQLPANLERYFLDVGGNEIAHVTFPDIPAKEVDE